MNEENATPETPGKQPKEAPQYQPKKAGEIVNVQHLTKAYGKHVLLVLGIEWLEQQPKLTKTEQRKFKVVQDMPTVEAYRMMRDEKFRMTWEDMVSDATSGIEDLASEMRSWAENMEGAGTGLGNTDKYSRVSEAADTLEGIQVDEPSGEIPSQKLIVYPLEYESSRAARASHYADMLESAATDIREWVEENEADERKDDLEQWADSLENAASELQNVEFPGMFG